MHLRRALPADVRHLPRPETLPVVSLDVERVVGRPGRPAGAGCGGDDRGHAVGVGHRRHTSPRT
jgi:hypothetical protein